jgi:hypothetical protein
MGPAVMKRLSTPALDKLQFSCRLLNVKQEDVNISRMAFVPSNCPVQYIVRLQGAAHVCSGSTGRCLTVEVNISAGACLFCFTGETQVSLAALTRNCLLLLPSHSGCDAVAMFQVHSQRRLTHCGNVSLDFDKIWYYDT